MFPGPKNPPALEQFGPYRAIRLSNFISEIESCAGCVICVFSHRVNESGQIWFSLTLVDPALAFLPEAFAEADFDYPGSGF